MAKNDLRLYDFLWDPPGVPKVLFRDGCRDLICCLPAIQLDLSAGLPSHATQYSGAGITDRSATFRDEP